MSISLPKSIASWRRQLIGTFSNNATEIPRWELELAKGDDVGHFGPESAVWAVHGSMTPIIAGIRALLLQALHPGAMAGVHDFSDYRSDPLGRLAGTIRWIFTVTYGSTTAAKAGSDWVLRLHERVHGTYLDADDVEQPYSANDPEIARWVHLAFTDAFLSSHQRYGGSIPGGPDAYVAEWAVAGELMGIPDPPRSETSCASRWRPTMTSCAAATMCRRRCGFCVGLRCLATSVLATGCCLPVPWPVWNRSIGSCSG